MSQKDLKTMKKEMKQLKKQNEDLAAIIESFKKKSKRTEDMSEYEDMKIEFEKTFAKIMEPAAYGKITIQDSKVVSIKVISLPTMIHNSENLPRVNIMRKGKYEESEFFTIWRKDPNALIYQELAFKPFPQVAKSDEFNLYFPPTIEKGKKVDISLMHEHLNSLCDRDEKSYKYLLAYIADMIQYPGRHNYSHSKSLVFCGEEGAGKGTLMLLLTSLLGESNVANTANISDLIPTDKNRFAEGCVNKILVCIEEMGRKEGENYEERFKDIITSEEVKYEVKNVQGIIKKPSYMRLMIFSNHTRNINIGDSNRRFIVNRTSYDNVGNVKFWRDLKQLYKSVDGIYTIYKYFMDYDISKFNFFDLPVSPLCKVMKSYKTSIIIYFLEDFINSKSPKPEYECQAKEFFNFYLAFVKEGNYKSDMTERTFGNELKLLIDDKKDSGISKYKKGNIYYHINVDKFKKFCELKKYAVFEELPDEPSKPKQNTKEKKYEITTDNDSDSSDDEEEQEQVKPVNIYKILKNRIKESEKESSEEESEDESEEEDEEESEKKPNFSKAIKLLKKK